MSTDLPPHPTLPQIFGPGNRPPRAPSFETVRGQIEATCAVCGREGHDAAGCNDAPTKAGERSDGC